MPTNTNKYKYKGHGRINKTKGQFSYQTNTQSGMAGQVIICYCYEICFVSTALSMALNKMRSYLVVLFNLPAHKLLRCWSSFISTSLIEETKLSRIYPLNSNCLPCRPLQQLNIVQCGTKIKNFTFNFTKKIFEKTTTHNYEGCFFQPPTANKNKTSPYKKCFFYLKFCTVMVNF